MASLAMLCCFSIAFCLSLLLLAPIPAAGLVNLFLPKWEMFSLVGLNAELYYLHDGKVNDYALGFQMPVPPEISQMHFAWRRDIPEPIPYSIALRQMSDISALKTPTINITKKGEVPMKEEIFCITLECTNYKTAEVNVEIIVNVTYQGDTTSLVLKRKKICLASIAEPTPTPNGGQVPPPLSPPTINTPYGNNAGEGYYSGPEVDNSVDPTVGMGPIAPDIVHPRTGEVISTNAPPTQQPILYIVLGSLVGIVLIVILLALVCFIRARTRQGSHLGSPAYSDCTTTLTLPKGNHPLHAQIAQAHHYPQMTQSAVAATLTYHQYQTLQAHQQQQAQQTLPQHCLLQYGGAQDRGASNNTDRSTLVNPLLFKVGKNKSGANSLLGPMIAPPPVPAVNPPNSLPIYSSSLFNSLQRRAQFMATEQQQQQQQQMKNGAGQVGSPSSHLYENPSPLDPHGPNGPYGGGGGFNIVPYNLVGTLGGSSNDGGRQHQANSYAGSARGSSCGTGEGPHFL